MRKTTKTAKTTKTRTTKKTPKVIARTQTPFEVMKDMATKSLRFGLGLGAYLLNNPQNIKLDALRGDVRKNFTEFVETAITKGQKIEKEQLDKLMSFEREQRKRVKEFLEARKRDLQRTEASLEEKIEEVITSLDIPTRQDIHQLNRRLNEISRELTRQKSTKSSNKSAKRTKRAHTAEVQSA